MFSVNITGVFMTAQAVAKSMLKYGTARGGSICLIASMSATIANRVPFPVTSESAASH